MEQRVFKQQVHWSTLVDWNILVDCSIKVQQFMGKLLWRQQVVIEHIEEHIIIIG